MRRVVVDLGCVDQHDASSLATLARLYKPSRMYGFDPSPLLDETITKIDTTPVTLSRKAAWLYDGTIRFHDNDWSSRISNVGEREVECFDFSAWLAKLKADVVVVKMDVEGAEVELLGRMIADGTDLRCDDLLVEWHSPAGVALERQVRCPVRRWWQ